MSNGNNSLNTLGEIPTATAAIFTPDMKRILLIFNDRLLAFVPPGGKQSGEDEGSMIYTMLREVEEETGMSLFVTVGDWLDKSGAIVPIPTIIQEERFEFEGKVYRDFLFFFHLIGAHKEQYFAEKIGKWYTKKTIKNPIIIIDGRVYQMLIPGIRTAILKVMV